MGAEFGGWGESGRSFSSRRGFGGGVDEAWTLPALKKEACFQVTPSNNSDFRYFTTEMVLSYWHRQHFTAYWWRTLIYFPFFTRSGKSLKDSYLQHSVTPLVMLQFWCFPLTSSFAHRPVKSKACILRLLWTSNTSLHVQNLPTIIHGCKREKLSQSGYRLNINQWSEWRKVPRLVTCFLLFKQHNQPEGAFKLFKINRKPWSVLSLRSQLKKWTAVGDSTVSV